MREGEQREDARCEERRELDKKLLQKNGCLNTRKRSPGTFFFKLKILKFNTYPCVDLKTSFHLKLKAGG